jgi:hypothetical protein
MTKTREPVDMSREAVTGRLEVVRALYKLMQSFREIRMDQARPVNAKPVNPQPPAKPPANQR